MDNETMLPMDWKPLREAAEANAREAHDAYAAVHRGYAAWDDLPDYEAGLDGDDPDHEGARIIGSPRRIFTDAHAALLANLRRPASRDWGARLLAEKAGLTVGATAPTWVRLGDTAWMLTAWTDEQCVMFGEGESLRRAIRPDRAFVVPGISTLTDPAAALRAALLAVVPA